MSVRGDAVPLSAENAFGRAENGQRLERSYGLAGKNASNECSEWGRKG